MDYLQWSEGKIENVHDLYSPAIFGATRNHRCECGKLVGELYDGMLCDKCLTSVVANAGLGHHRRIGDIPLAIECKNPMVTVIGDGQFTDVEAWIFNLP